jgi:hypothetical protein
MSMYTVALFLHVSGAIGAFISLGIWLFGLATLRQARIDKAIFLPDLRSPGDW